MMDGVGSLAVVFVVAKITRSKTAGILVAALVVIGLNLIGENLPIELFVGRHFCNPVADLPDAGGTLVDMCQPMRCLRPGGLESPLRLVALVRLARIDENSASWLAIALYGFKVALAGKPIFGGAFED